MTVPPEPPGLVVNSIPPELQALLYKARLGRRVLVLASTGPIARKLLEGIAETSWVTVGEVRRHRDGGSLTWQDGSMHFGTMGNSAEGKWRGITADVIYVHDPDNRWTAEHEQNLAPILSASDKPEWIFG